MEDLKGQQFGAYQILEPLGEGGMAAVYQGYQPGVDRIVAIKVLPKQLAADPEFLGRFEQEAKMLAQLQHPHILPVFDYGKANDYTYIVMPLLTNGSLSDRLHGQSLPITETVKIISQIGDALDYAHSRGVIHRDIKPSNVLLDERDNCLLSDFGIARMYEATSRFTATGGILGTPAYMSPEQGRGEKLDQRSDIYSLGVVLYELATGRVPYQAETPIAVIFKHIEGPLPPPRTINPNLSQQVERVILKAMAKNPEDRFATAGDFVLALQQASKTDTNESPGIITLPPTSPPTPTSAADSKDKKTPWWIFALAGLLLLLIIAGLWGIFGRDKNNLGDTPLLSTQVTPSNSDEGGGLLAEPDASPTSTQIATQTMSEIETPSVLESATEPETVASSTPQPPSPTPEPTPTLTPQIWPVNEGIEACHLIFEEQIAARENTRLWSDPDVEMGSLVSSVDPGAIVEVVDGPVWGSIRRDIDFSGWWWLVKVVDSNNSQKGWVWEARLEKCALP